MKRFKLMKYKYGLRPHVFTAFSVVPLSAQDRPNNRHTRHFQTPESAKAYLGSIGAEIIDADWRELPGTGILRSDSERRAPKQLILGVA